MATTSRDLSPLDLAPTRKTFERRMKEIRDAVKVLEKEHSHLEKLVGDIGPGGNGDAPVEASPAAPAASAGAASRPAARQSRARSTRTRRNQKSSSGGTASGESTASAAAGARVKGAPARRGRPPGSKDSAPRRQRVKAAPRTGRPVSEQTDKVVSLLEQGPKARTDLASALGVSASRIQQLLAPLLDQGRVSPRKDQQNPRRNLWALTA